MLTVLKKIEKFLIQTLMVMMAVILTLATIDLGWTIIKDMSQPPYLIISVEQLLDLFGLIMLVLIGIELLETIMKTYLTQSIPHYEVVISVAIIAIARKVIILDIKETSGLTLVGIAAIVLSLTVGYSFMKKASNSSQAADGAPPPPRT